QLNEFVRTLPVGSLFYVLQNFNVNHLLLDDLQKFLSLYFSYVDNVAVAYEDYKIKKDNEPIKARPALIFEKVDADKSLYIRLGQVLPNADISFLDEYDLFSYVTINELEKLIVVRPIEQLPVENLVAEIEKILLKYADKGKRKQNSGILREDNLLIVPEHIASEFVYKEIPSLIGAYSLIGSEKLKEFKININPPRLNVQLGHGIDFLEGTATLDFGDQNISLFDAFSQFNKNRYIVLADGSHALVNEAYMLRLQRIFRKKKDKVEISFFDLPLVDELIEERTAGEQFIVAREIFSGFNKLETKKVKLPEVNATLRAYQKQGFKWLQYLYKNNLGGCLADDMGLGKTLQTITLLTEIYVKKKEKTPSIIAMPKSLLFNWESELKKFSPNITFYTWYGSNRNLKEAKKANVILTTYAMLRNDVEVWKEEKFHYAILDESQAIKNLQSQLHKAVMLVNASHRLALSGTPIENNLSELYALFRFLNPAMFGSSENFNKNYLNPIQKNNDLDATKALRRKIYPFILRRLKKDVLKELPDKIEQTLYVEMSDQQAIYYEQRRQYYKQAIDQQVAVKGIQQSQFFIFQAMNELRQIASVPEVQTGGRIESPKIELLMEQLEDALANRHKVLVFANYLAAVESIGEELDKRGVDFVTMTGSTRHRKELVDRFQNNPECQVFILTLKTGGTGLNLTAADMVFIFDPWWNKAAESQAIDRTHRIGQNKKVMSFKLITMNTIEEKMLKLQEAKSALFDNIISSDNASLKSLTEEDIEFVLGK
ncbi:MAG: DEAD/DEAH box helicase, partial [Bacteroidota bacterium]|nr:DEAD/DEAH box helicase [Bacteroidota bacterium]